MPTQPWPALTSGSAAPLGYPLSTGHKARKRRVGSGFPGPPGQRTLLGGCVPHGKYFSFVAGRVLWLQAGGTHSQFMSVAVPLPHGVLFVPDSRIACTAEEPEAVLPGMLIDVAKYLGSLQYDVWKRMLGIIPVGEALGNLHPGVEVQGGGMPCWGWSC